MDLYGLNAARAEGNMRTSNNELYNEQIKTARDNINNALDNEKITAAGNLRDQESKDTQDKIFYDIHDALGGAGIASSVGRLGESVKEFQSLRAAGDTRGFGRVLWSSQRNLARKVNPKLNLQFGSATQKGDKIAEATKTEVSAIKGEDPIEMTSLTGKQSADLNSAVGTQDFEEARRGLRANIEKTPVGGEAARTPQETALLDEGGEKANQLNFQDAVASLRNRVGKPQTPGQGVETESSNTNTGDENRPTTTKPADDIEDATGDEKTGAGDPAKPPEGIGGELKDVGEDLTGKGGGEEESLLGKVAGKASKVAGGLRVLNDVSGGIATYELFKNGLAKNKDGTMDTWKDVSQVAGAVGTGLDILGAFVPALEPIGAIAQGISAVADTVDTHNKDEQATTDAQADADNVEKTRQAQLDALPSEKPPTAPINNMVAGGLVGTQSQHINNATQGTGSF